MPMGEGTVRMNLLESADFIAPSQTTTKTQAALDTLRFDNRFTRDLPADPENQNRRRQVALPAT